MIKLLPFILLLAGCASPQDRRNTMIMNCFDRSTTSDMSGGEMGFVLRGCLEAIR